MLKSNICKPKGAILLHQTLDRIFTNGSQVRVHQDIFMSSLRNLVRKQKELELANALRINANEDFSKTSYSKRELQETRSNLNAKYHKFYSQNLMIKAFYTLLKYSKKKRELINREQQREDKVYAFVKERFFKRWRRAYNHKINQLENRK